MISGRSAVETPTALVLTLRDGGLPKVTGVGVRAYEPDRRRAAAFWAASYIREDQVSSAFRTDIREIPVADQGSGLIAKNSRSRRRLVHRYAVRVMDGDDVERILHQRTKTRLAFLQGVGLAAIARRPLEWPQAHGQPTPTTASRWRLLWLSVFTLPPKNPGDVLRAAGVSYIIYL